MVMTLTACQLIGGKDVYTELNTMARMEYNTINMEVQTTYQGVTLVNKYSALLGANGTIVTYSVESLATIDPEVGMPENMIETKTGSATIRDGKIVSQTGDDVTIPTSMSALAIHFDEAYFDTPKTYAEGSLHVFDAKVKDVKGFTGSNTFEGKDMRVCVRYNEKLDTVVIDYTSENGAGVKVIYKFR